MGELSARRVGASEGKQISLLDCASSFEFLRSFFLTQRGRAFLSLAFPNLANRFAIAQAVLCINAFSKLKGLDLKGMFIIYRRVRRSFRANHSRHAA